MPYSTAAAARLVFVMAEFQQMFSSALLDAEADIPAGLKAPNGGSANRRFAVYRNNVTHSLVNALADIFPSIQSLVGEEYFRAMARIYVEKNPPRSPMLFEYGATFAEFIEEFEPAKKLPYLPDVARLERLWLDAFHAADATPLDSALLAAVEPEKLGDIRFTAHPATRLLRSTYAAVTIVSRSRQAASMEGLNATDPEFGLVTRPEFDPIIYNLPEGDFVFFEHLIDDATLGEAAGIAMETDASFDLSGAITNMISAGAFTAIKP